MKTMNHSNTQSGLGWSFRLGRLLGIDVHVHFTFLLLLGFIGLTQWIGSRSLEAAGATVVFFVGVFLCVLLHEYGHALAARRYGIATRDITLLPIGGLARLERMPDKPWQELVVAVAGPMVNVVIAAALFAGLWLRGYWEDVEMLTLTSGNLVERLLFANVFLVAFNLLPAFPMDGGRVLRALLALKMPYARATRIAARTGQFMAALFGFAGLFGNPMLLLIALFVWIGAAQEAGAAEMKSSLTGAAVADAMLTDFRVLRPQNTLGDATRLLLAGSQQDFPVVDRGEVIGMLTRSELLAVLRERGEDVPVEKVMRSEFATLEATDPLETALASANVEKGLAMPVLAGGRLSGLVTAENIGEFLMIRSALRAAEWRRSSPPVPPMIPPPLSRTTPASRGI